MQNLQINQSYVIIANVFKGGNLFMEEIDLKELLRYAYRKKFIIIATTLIVALIGMIYFGFIQKPKYVSSTTLILTSFSNEKENDTINNNDLTMNQKLVTTYQEITKTRKVLNQVIDNLGLEYSASELANHVSVTGVTGTEIIRISVYDRDASLACSIANEIATIFSKEVKEIYNISNVSILDVAEVATSPSNISFIKATVIAFILGFILSIGIVFVIFYFDNTIKSVEQLEEKFDVPILGTVPIYSVVKREAK